MKKNRKPIMGIVLCCLSAVLLWSALTFSVSASQTGGSQNSGTFRGIGSGVLSEVTDIPVDDFESDRILWKTAEAEGEEPDDGELPTEEIPEDPADLPAAEISLCRRNEEYPYLPFGGTGCLKVSAPGERTVICREWTDNENPLEAEGVQSLVLAFFAPERAEGYTLIADIRAENAAAENVETGEVGDGEEHSPEIVFASSEIVDGGAWQTVVIDFSYCAEYDLNIRKITLTVLGAEGSYCLIDSVGLCTQPDVPFALRCLCRRITPSGGTLTGDDGLSFEMNSIDPYIESSSLICRNITDSAISFRMKNESNCKSVTLYYSRTGSYTPEQSIRADLPLSGGVRDIVFAIPMDEITSFRLVFDGNNKGTVHISSISQVRYPKSASYPGTIGECVIENDKSTVSVRGTLSQTAADRYRGDTLTLWALDLCDSTDNLTAGNAEPVASALCLSSDFSFSWKDGILSGGLFKKYVVTVSHGGSDILLTSAKYVTDPESLAPETGSTAPAVSKKGMSAPEISDLLMTGSGYTEIEIDLCSLFSASRSGRSFSYDGRTYYFSENALNSLKAKLDFCRENGIRVYVTLTAKRGGGADKYLIHPDAEKGCRYAAFNTTDSEGIAYLRAGCEMLAGMFEGEGVAGVCVGVDPADSIQNYSMGAGGLVPVARAYSDALRIVYNVFRSHDPQMKICVSLGCEWNRGISPDEKYVFDSRSMLDTVAAIISAGGDIGWSLAYDPYPENADYVACADDTLTDSTDAERITMGNIGQLTGYMMSGEKDYGGNYRRIALIEHGYVTAGEDDELAERLAADYAYSYYLIGTPNYSLIDAYIVSRDLSRGEIYKYIDTNRSLEVTEPALRVLGYPDWLQAVPLFDAERIVCRRVSEKELMAGSPDGMKGQTVLCGFEKGAESGWSSSVGNAEFYAGMSLGNHDDLMNVTVRPAYKDKYSGIRTDFGCVYDLTDAPYLTFDAEIAVLPSGQSAVEICVTVFSGESYVTGTGILNAGGWNTFTLDMTGFDGLSACDGMAVWLRGVDGKDIGEPTLVIDEIKLLSPEYDSEHLGTMLENARAQSSTEDKTVQTKTTVYVLVGVLAAAILAETVYIAVRLVRLRRED